MRIPILYDDRLLSCGIISPIYWDTDAVIHALIVGPSGSGKTYVSKLLVAKLALHDPELELFVCDAKGDRDFDFLNDASKKNFWRFTDCADGLSEFYDRLRSRQSGQDETRNTVVLLFSEWAAFINSLDKKAGEEAKRKMSVLLMVARSFYLQIIIDTQRPDANMLPNGARSNVGLILGMSNLTEETKRMVFTEYADKMPPDRRRGTGYLLQNGTALKACVVGKVEDMDKLNHTIKQAVER